MTSLYHSPRVSISLCRFHCLDKRPRPVQCQGLPRGRTAPSQHSASATATLQRRCLYLSISIMQISPAGVSMEAGVYTEVLDRPPCKPRLGVDSGFTLGYTVTLLSGRTATAAGAPCCHCVARPAAVRACVPSACVHALCVRACMSTACMRAHCVHACTP
jgi:hypothetical protein